MNYVARLTIDIKVEANSMDDAQRKARLAFIEVSDQFGDNYPLLDVALTIVDEEEKK